MATALETDGSLMQVERNAESKVLSALILNCIKLPPILMNHHSFSFSDSLERFYCIKKCLTQVSHNRHYVKIFQLYAFFAINEV